MTNARSDEALEYRYLYDLAEWKRLRLWQLSRNPLCELCREEGRVTDADVVNHRKPHHGDLALFFDPANLQSVCKLHHDGPIQSRERTGIERGCDEHGTPLEPTSHWHRPG